eukprot:m.306664 g.306664  ORF g.306664 m.306664 type:complete len:304 (-) comp16352_c0_seq7:89-1000(-)
MDPLKDALAQWCTLIVDAKGIGISAWDTAAMQRALSWATQLEQVWERAAHDDAEMTVLADAAYEAHWHQSAFGIGTLQHARSLLLHLVIENRHTPLEVSTQALRMLRSINRERESVPSDTRAESAERGNVAFLNAVATMIYALNRDDAIHFDCQVGRALRRGDSLGPHRAAVRVLRSTVTDVLWGDHVDEDVLDTTDELEQRRKAAQPRVDVLLSSIVDSHYAGLELIAEAAILAPLPSWGTLARRRQHNLTTDAFFTWIVSNSMTAAANLNTRLRDSLTLASPIFAEMLAVLDYAEVDSLEA